MKNVKELHLCDWPDCMEEALYPAPRNPKNLSDRFHFCLEHVKAYNKEWDGLKGFSESDLHNMRTGATWDRPTWQIGLDSPSKQAAEALMGNIKDPFKFFDESKQQAKEEEKIVIPEPLKKACALLNLDFPIDAEKAKQRYKKMVKLHHPDLNRNAPEKAERQLKDINLAFQEIKAYLKEQG